MSGNSGALSELPASEGVTGRALRAMLVEQGYRCPLTGEQLTPTNAALDHKTAVAVGGTNDLSNLWIVHKEANRMKGTLTTEEFVLWCERVAAYAKSLGRANKMSPPTQSAEPD